MRRDDVTALVLAGGRATRMGGVDKRALVVEGRTIFARQRDVLAPRVAEIVVSLAPGGVDATGLRTVTDALAGVGPLAGIAAGLAAVTTPWLFVVAGDMPFISEALVDRMLAAAKDDIEAVGVRLDGMPEPLLCVLRVAPARAAVARRLEAHRYKASALLTDEGLRIAWLDETDARVVRNVNAPDDLR